MKLHPVFDDPSAVVVFRAVVPSEPAWPDFRRAAREALSAFQLRLEGEKAVLKPNVTVGEYHGNPESGIQTHPAFVWGIAEYLKENGVRRGGVYVLEDPRDTDDNNPRHWKGTGYLEVAEATGAKLRCPTSFTCVKKPVARPHVWPYQNVSRLAVDPNGTVLLNVPKFKTHNLGITTLCMKNLMGVVNAWDRHYCGQAMSDLPPEVAAEVRTKREAHELYQEGLGKRLSDLAQAVQPHLNIVEGVIGRDGTGFQRGSNYPLGLVVAGRNMVAVDSVCSFIMGFDPRKIVYLRVAAETGLGTNDLADLRLYSVGDGEIVPCARPETLRAQPRFRVITGVAGDDSAYYG
ncbi:MAG: DUF362 domain-containing protein [Armatimonadetes bacterium]|nr:DUF362 domain-containing protein [Armatimonadota bacterium]